MPVLKGLINFFTSAKVGIVVMVILAVLSLMGATIPQGGSREAYSEVYGGFWGGLIWRLGLSDVFRSDYYTALLILLSIMVFACSLRRLPQKIRLARTQEPIFESSRLAGMPAHAELVLDLDQHEAALHVVDVCRRRFYAVRKQVKGDAAAVFAAKMAFSRYGSFLLHLSFIFLLLGGLAITRLGFHDYRDIRVGSEFTLQVSGDRSVQVVVEDFTVEVDENDQVSDYICEAVLTREDEIISRHSIRPNHPLRFGGREVFLVSYREDPGEPQGLVVSVFDSLGQVVIPHLFLDMEYPRYVDELSASARLSLGVLPGVRLLFDDGTVETFILGHEFDASGEPGGGYRFVLMYAVPALIVTLEVVKEPFQWLIIVGFALLTIGSFISLYLSHRRIWFIVSPLPDARARVVFGGSCNRNSEGFAKEFEIIRRTLDELS